MIKAKSFTIVTALSSTANAEKQPLWNIVKGEDEVARPLIRFTESTLHTIQIPRMHPLVGEEVLKMWLYNLPGCFHA